MSETTSANPTTEIRRKIFQDMCRSVVWIDEEIFAFTRDGDGKKNYLYGPFHDLFQPVMQELQAAGFLVHLHSFEQSTDEIGFDDEFAEESPSLSSAVELSKKADITILDWHLGNAGNPENSIKILKSLLKTSATRFVIILSQYAERFMEEISESNLTGLIRDAQSDAWISENGLHLKVLSKKPDGNNWITAGEITDAVYDLVSKHYPDYIHWAAIEISAKIRNHVPEWLKGLPNKTDLAVLQELLDENSEIRSALPENLFEDLVSVASTNQLESLDPANTKREHWENRPTFLQDSPESKKEKYINVLKSAKNLRNDLSDFLAELDTITGGSEWLDSQQSLVEFCERLSLPENSVQPFPGAVYLANDTENNDDSIFICASQGCDCIRNSPLLFLKAIKTEDSKASSTSLQFQGETYRIDSNSENLIPLKIEEDRTIATHRKIGQLRPQIAVRIISRFWTGTTRPAVNHPNFARALRIDEV